MNNKIKLKKFAELIHNSPISRVKKGDESILFNLDGNEYYSTSPEMFFQDGKRRIDYVLVFKSGEMDDTIKSKRYAFLSALAAQMIEIEVENCQGEILAKTGPQSAGFKDDASFQLVHPESPVGDLTSNGEFYRDDHANPLEAAIHARQDLVFVKLHASWSTLIRVAEVLQFKKPLKQLSSSIKLNLPVISCIDRNIDHFPLAALSNHANCKSTGVVNSKNISPQHHFASVLWQVPTFKCDHGHPRLGNSQGHIFLPLNKPALLRTTTSS
ncbi:unnamed protein product [Rodentolepis nana]|uniref:Anoct_dimer domain-containing protein n=1 Tax=Rodentolepis nana TaxID=102285 RepID=A0A0R3T3K2_RODNA|nr:unnamed protein product [Rodentolepis nana]